MYWRLLVTPLVEADFVDLEIEGSLLHVECDQAEADKSFRV
jgi:hypothetical protein